MNDMTMTTAVVHPLPKAPFEGRHLIDGIWQGSADGATFDRISPSHGVVVSRSARGWRIGD